MGMSIITKEKATEYRKKWRNKNKEYCKMKYYENKQEVKDKYNKDIIGNKYGKLTIIKKDEDRKNNHGARTYWICQCDCGNIKSVQGYNLKNGNTKSCGCLQKEKVKEYNKQFYGKSSKNDLYHSYKNCAKSRDIEFKLTKDQFFYMTKQECYYCGQLPSQVHKNNNSDNGDYIYNGIDRVDSLKGYIIENCVPCCKKCNISKRDMNVKDFIKQCYIITMRMSLAGQKFKDAINLSTDLTTEQKDYINVLFNETMMQKQDESSQKVIRSIKIEKGL